MSETLMQAATQPKTKMRRRRAAGERLTANTTETRAVLMVRLTRPVLDLPRDTMLMLTGGQPGDRTLELTVPGTQRRICFTHYEVDCGCSGWDFGPSEAMIQRNIALADARYDFPNLRQVLERRMAKLRLAWGHKQITVPGRELVVWAGDRSDGADGTNDAGGGL